MLRSSRPGAVARRHRYPVGAGAATSVSPDLPLSEYFVAMSEPKGKGHNIVNVILVDFRGLDTMVEIMVLSVAALGVYSLLRLKPSSTGEVGDE